MEADGSYAILILEAGAASDKTAEPHHEPANRPLLRTGPPFSLPLRFFLTARCSCWLPQV